MNSGFLFYWFAWILWIIVTFFMPKNRLRTLLACWLLILILCSNLYIAFDDFHLSVSYLVLIAGALVLHARLSGMLFQVFSSFTIMIGYSTILIWESYSPLKLFLPSFLTISCILFILITSIITGLWNRLACGLLGMAGGEFLYSIILSSYVTAPDVIGDKRFLDFILVLTVGLVCYDLIVKLKLKIAQRLHQSMPKSKPLFRKEAQ